MWKRDRKTRPFALEGLDHVALVVDDMAATQRFYRDVIGCPVETALPQDGMVQLRAGAALIDLVDISGPEGIRGGARGDGLSFYVKDPAGNVLELKAPS